MGLISRPTNINTQKIDGFPLKTYDMAPAKFLLQNSLEKMQFFEKTFLLADTSIKVVLKMIFFFLAIKTSCLVHWELFCRFYTTAKALPIIKRIKLIDKYQFVKVALDKNSETFIIYVATLKTPKMTIYFSYIA